MCRTGQDCTISQSVWIRESGIHEISSGYFVVEVRHLFEFFFCPASVWRKEYAKPFIGKILFDHFDSWREIRISTNVLVKRMVNIEAVYKAYDSFGTHIKKTQGQFPGGAGRNAYG